MVWNSFHPLLPFCSITNYSIFRKKTSDLQSSSSVKVDLHRRCLSDLQRVVSANSESSEVVLRAIALLGTLYIFGNAELQSTFRNSILEVFCNDIYPHIDAMAVPRPGRPDGYLLDRIYKLSPTVIISKERDFFSNAGPLDWL